MYEKIADRAWRVLFRRSYRRQRVRDMGQGSDMGDGDGKPDVAGEGKGFDLINNASTRGVGPRVWRYAEPLYYRDVDGVLRVIPEGFACDMRSSPRVTWLALPPKCGVRDHAWGIHDFETRCWRIMGLDLAEVNGRRFDAAMQYFGKGSVSRWLHVAAVRLASRLSSPEGDGIHRQPQYNTDVYCDVRGEFVSLPEWFETQPGGISKRHAEMSKTQKVEVIDEDD